MRIRIRNTAHKNTVTFFISYKNLFMHYEVAGQFSPLFSQPPCPVLRIRVVYPGSEFFSSRIRIFSIPDPDPHQRI